MARILIVDDELTIRELIKEVLSAGGHDFIMADNGQKALELLRTHGADLAIVDRNMPGMTGVDLVQAVRAIPQYKNVKLLMCTAASVTKEIDEAFAAGADDYILKPLQFATLIAKVSKALAAPPAR